MTIDSDRLPSFYQVIFFQAMAVIEALQKGGSYGHAKADIEKVMSVLDNSCQDDLPVFKRNRDLLLWSIARQGGQVHSLGLVETKIESGSCELNLRSPVPARCHDETTLP